MTIISGDSLRPPTAADNLRVAYNAAERGWRVFPQRVADGMKVPAIRRWTELASTNPAELQAWWSASNNLQDCVPGIATGKESGCWVLDPDTKHDVDGRANLATLCEQNDCTIEELAELALIVRTPSGGQHWYFAYPPERGDGDIYIKNRADRTALAPGVDVRGDRGQVVAPGSRVQFGGLWCEYQIIQDRPSLEFAPLWLEALVVGPRRLQDTAVNEPEIVDMSTMDQRVQDRIHSYLEACVNAACRRVAAASEGSRNTELNRGAFALGGWAHMGLTREIALENLTSACSYDGNGLLIDDPEGFAATFASGWNSGLRMPLQLPAHLLEDTTVTTTATPDEVRNRNTDQANAEEFARRFSSTFAWTPEWKWLRFDGTHWTPDDTEQRTLRVADIAQDLWAISHTAEEAERVVYRRRAVRLESAAGVASALDLAGPRMATTIRAFDTDPYLLNCTNGTLDLRTGRLRPHNSADMITQLAPTPFHPTAHDDVWEKVVHEAFDGDPDRIRVFQRYMGYTLTGLVKEKRFIVAYGPTNTAKSTLTEPFIHVLGSVIEDGYATTWDTDMVQASSRINRAEKMNKARAARYIVVGEIEHGAKLADAFVKRFTGGDSVDARALYKGSYDVRPVGKLWMVTNYIPRSADPAVHGRLLMLPMTHVPEQIDRTIKQHLDENSGAHQAMLAWAVRGCQEWMAEGLGEMPWLEREVDDYARSSDHILDFIAQCLVTVEPGIGVGILPHDMYTVYQPWAAMMIEKPFKMRDFEAAMRSNGYDKRRVGKGSPVLWQGVEFKPTVELPKTVRHLFSDGGVMSTIVR